MSKPTTLDKAIQDRDALADTILYLESELTKSAERDLACNEINHLLEESIRAQETLVEIHTRIRHANAPDFVPHINEYLYLRGRCTKLISSFTGKKMRYEASHRSTNSESGNSTSSGAKEIKLPRLELPCFDGNVEEWISFRDLFVTAVHNNSELSKSQKFTYLKSKLKGEPLRSIQSIIITDSNYDIAWEQLSNRYHSERELLFATMKKLLNQPIIVEPSAKAIRQLVDTTRESLRSLEVLDCPVQNWDAMVVYLLCSKLDNTSKQQWEQSLKDSKIPKLHDTFEFLESRARALAASFETHKAVKAITRTEQISQRSKSFEMLPKRNSVRTHHTQASACVHCTSTSHFIQNCPAFRHLPVETRVEMVKKHQLCQNCMRGDHTANNCNSKHRCRTCQSNHHTLIHLPSGSTAKDGTVMHTSLVSQSTPAVHETLLATASVRVPNSIGIHQICRAFLDNGAQQNYITDAMARKLGLKRHRQFVTISGLGSTEVGTSKWVTNIQVSPHFNRSIVLNIAAYIVPSITDNLPGSFHDPHHWLHLSNLQLADPFYHIPAKVDLLLGAEVFYEIILPGKRSSKDGGPVALNSSFGWLVGGGSSSLARSCTFLTSASAQSTSHCITTTDKLLQSFWELESVPTSPILSIEEKQCLSHFENTHSRMADGRFMVKIPFKSPLPKLGETFSIALRRLKSMERKLDTNPDHRSEYNKFMKQYESMGHMEKIQATPYTMSCYIPHHYVLKHDSSTTKFRVVFDGSAKSSNSVSVNSTMSVGPTVQDSLFNIILRFRIHKIAFKADIEKMYRQIRVTDDDADMQRILWRENPLHEIQHFKLKTVTYGTAAAPFLATQCLVELGRSNSTSYPDASKIITRDFYVDDLMSGASSVLKAVRLQTEIMKILSTAKMPLRKWMSNSSEFLSSLPPELIETAPCSLNDHEQVSIKTLGICWNPASDEFEFKFVASNSANTKREVLSEISKTFDPLGWISPITIRGKIFMQKLWLAGVNWDEKLPDELLGIWHSIRSDSDYLSAIKVPRNYFRGLCITEASEIHLVGFCDASEMAFAAVIYIVSYKNEEMLSSTLITSKTRVAPCKRVSIARLELCSALLCAELFIAIKKALGIIFTRESCWTDSMDALCWIRAHPSKWKPFVANRVTQIHEATAPEIWGHVKGTSNPADIASRGSLSQDLANNNLWWNGPTELQTGIPNTVMKMHEPSLSQSAHNEMKQKTFTTGVHEIEDSIIRRFSSFTRAVRVIAYMLRFMYNTKKTNKQGSNTLNPSEIEDATTRLVKATQGKYFVDMLKDFNAKKPTKVHANLSPFLDEKRLIRVGGRMKHSHLSPDQRHPILLPRNAHLTKLIIEHFHVKLGHGGSQLTLAAIQRKYWVIRGRDAIRLQLHKCVKCTKLKASTMQQVMAHLPAFRVTQARPFQRVGIDFAGPLLIKPILPRSRITVKAYVCLFVCVVTRAFHIEVVSGLSTEAFLATYRRFVSRRGLPSDVYSDNGTNFAGAANELDVIKWQQDNEFQMSVQNATSLEGTTWHFNPPASPHFGGLWEAGIKSIKYHLRRIMGNNRLTFEELTTCTAQIEAILNSRPLTPISSDPDDLSALTPGHFLIGQPLQAVPDANFQDIQLSRLSRWQMIQSFMQQFWKRWTSEYLTRMQSKPKWFHPNQPITIGDMVILKEDNLPPLQWKLGRVTSTFPGSDGIIRVVNVKTSTGELKRPIVKLCRLPMDDGSQIEACTSREAGC